MSRTPIFRRTAPVVAIAAVAALALTGCGRGGDDTSSSAAAPAVSEGPATGTIEVWVPGADGEALPNILGDFETANPDVTINVTQIPEGEFDAKVLTAISTGTTPDMVSLPSQSQSTLLATEGFAAVPDGLVDPASFFSSIYEPGVIEGVSYTVPWYAYANTLQYRKDLAEKAGVTPPTTWDEVQPFADALQDAGADFGWALDVGYDAYTAQGLNEYVLQNGGSFVSEDGASWTINDPKNVEALEFWAKLIEDGNASPDGPGFLDVVPFFTEGTIGSRVNGPWFQGWLNDANGEDWTETHLGTATLPAGPDGTSVSSLGGGSFAVFDDAANADGAWKLAQYLAEPETQIAWYDEFGSLPAVESAWDEPVIADNELLDATRTAMATAVPVPQLSTWTEVASILGQQIERVSRGQATAQEALDEAQAQAESIGTGVE